jgi:hypothetical protein
MDWELLTDSGWLSVHLKLLLALVRLTQWVPSECNALCTSISVAAFVYSDIGMFESEGEDVFSGSGGVFLEKQRNIKWWSLK